MSKKVLVIDDPKTCRYCIAHGGVTCKATNREYPQSAFALMRISDNYKPTWCPLRDVPEHKLDWRAGENGYETGWNDCLDVIGVE